ncbi:MAG: IS1634 family transposase [Desulfobacterales bacterium]|jgi:transposase|nr:IS1634 family transposase [Desulfobacterales bacterium]
MKFNWYLKHHHHNYYSLVEPYRENGKNRHRVITYLSGLTPEDVQQIKRGLGVMKGLEIETTNIEDLIFENHWRYLDVAFLDVIWKQWKLSKIFPQSDGKDVQTSEIVEILTLYRCLDPGSYLSAVDWFNKTALDRILHINGQHINKSRIFRELDIIEDRKEDIERYLYKTLKKRDEGSMNIVFYDLTDSYFEGRKCELARAGRTKSNGFRKKRVVLSLLVNSAGYPFAWDILEDYTADVKTIKDLSIKWKKEFKFNDNEIVLVFDRGMVSDENLKHLELEKYKYITALDKNQIPGTQKVNIERFKSINEENMTEQIIKMGFMKYDDTTYYENLGTVDGRRYVLIFNPEMLADQRKSRKELIQRAKYYLDKENEALSGAKKSRNRGKTKNRIDKQLKAMKAMNFVDYDLEPLIIKADGREINSFHIAPKETDENREAIKKAERTDGLWTIVTNTPSKGDDENGFTEDDLIRAYRDKNQIEQAFKDVKSFIKIQPFNVWTPKHVRAHYTICVLSYLLDITIANRLKEVDIGVRSTQKVYEVLKEGIIGKITVESTGDEFLKLMSPQSQQKAILELFQSENVVRRGYLKSMGIK